MVILLSWVSSEIVFCFALYLVVHNCPRENWKSPRTWKKNDERKMWGKKKRKSKNEEHFLKLHPKRACLKTGNKFLKRAHFYRVLQNVNGIDPVDGSQNPKSNGSNRGRNRVYQKTFNGIDPVDAIEKSGKFRWFGLGL